MKTITLPFYWGQKVKFKSTNIKAYIVSICISESSARYSCAWISDGKRYTDWFYDFEIEADGHAEKLKIGFGNKEKGNE